jgi:hypothetical protein
MMLDSGPFQYGISSMAGFYFPVYGYGQISYRAMPNVMIALTVPY